MTMTYSPNNKINQNFKNIKIIGLNIVFYLFISIEFFNIITLIINLIIISYIATRRTAFVIISISTIINIIIIVTVTIKFTLAELNLIITTSKEEAFTTTSIRKAFTTIIVIVVKTAQNCSSASSVLAFTIEAAATCYHCYFTWRSRI